jgi:hypothetical protein
MNELDTALVACLIRFARRGRVLREQCHGQNSFYAHPSAGTKEEALTGIFAQDGSAR